MRAGVVLQVYDFKMTDAKLHEILHSNLMAAEYVRVRDQILKGARPCCPL